MSEKPGFGIGDSGLVRGRAFDAMAADQCRATPWLPSPLEVEGLGERGRSFELLRIARDAAAAKRRMRFGWGAFARPVAPRAGTRAGGIYPCACAMIRRPEHH